MADSDKKISFKDTLNLPRTDFPIRPNAKENDPLMLERWQQEKLSEVSFTHNEGKEKFILHDGPPYANGHLHLGHAYNKVLKDIVTKAQRMLGKHVPVTPGWDCHGLPIELKVTQEQPGLEPVALKKACRVYAQKWIDVQRDEFKKLGVLMDWDNPYLTMNPGYEASILRAFGGFVADGYIERKNKTVPWCSSCQTVLASAEIEYQERKDPSTYVLFPLKDEAVEKVLPGLSGKTVNLLVWTTTPWTLPLNRAVMLRPKADYVVLDIKGQFVIVAQKLADKVSALAEVATNIVANFKSDDLIAANAHAHHPFIEELTVPLLLDASVSLEDGTACVHCAPGCGPEDYEIGVRNRLEIFSPITSDGKYAQGIVPAELKGMPVADGQIWVLKKLVSTGRLFAKKSLRHPYPHCWRCRNGLIFRATKQWFCDLAKGGLKQRVLDALPEIKTIPEKSVNRLAATVEGRLEWCLSRQRVWGVPIPALLCVKCDYTYISQGLIESVAEKVADNGVEYWDTVPVADVLPQNFACPNCKGTEFKKETDILDVWFDSGVSHYAVLSQRKELGMPADMYLEGKDQHRGWFQSSLLTSMVLNDKPPMKTILTHGFTVDKKGRKMSKSLGNVVAPQEMIDKLGTDGLRLWVSSIDCSGEAVVSDVLVKNVAEVYRKIRNTARFLLSNLYDYDKDKDAVPFDKMLLIDRYALQELAEFNHAVLQSYADVDFTATFHKFADYVTTRLSSFYLDIVKDRLYTEKADGLERRSAQTACWYILDSMTRLMAPILSFTAEHISDGYQKDKKQSIHLQEFTFLQSIWEMIALKKLPAVEYAHYKHGETKLPFDVANFVAEHEQRWALLKTMRSALLKAIEGLREQGVIKHSLEARVTVTFDETLLSALQDFFGEIDASGQRVQDFFREFIIVSQFAIADKPDGLVQSEHKGLLIKVEKALGDKCPRCWQWEVTKHEHKLCNRCQKIIGV